MPYSLWLTSDGVAIHGSNVRWGWRPTAASAFRPPSQPSCSEALNVGDEVQIVSGKPHKQTAEPARKPS